MRHCSSSGTNMFIVQHSAHLAFRSILSALFILGLASAEAFMQAKATLSTASIWFLMASDVRLMLKSRICSHFCCCVQLLETQVANLVPSLTASFPVTSSSRITPKL
uniref:Uncharacterized protein n=1 Tax=Opuntia streptacantha TaxID=393608 RepID=A0A7C8ZH25_OPUST